MLMALFSGVAASSVVVDCPAAPAAPVPKEAREMRALVEDPTDSDVVLARAMDRLRARGLRVRLVETCPRCKTKKPRPECVFRRAADDVELRAVKRAHCLEVCAAGRCVVAHVHALAAWWLHQRSNEPLNLTLPAARRCAVVGPSQSNNWGSTIDGYDQVVRVGRLPGACEGRRADLVVGPKPVRQNGVISVAKSRRAWEKNPDLLVLPTRRVLEKSLGPGSASVALTIAVAACRHVDVYGGLLLDYENTETFLRNLVLDTHGIANFVVA